MVGTIAVAVVYGYNCISFTFLDTGNCMGEASYRALGTITHAGRNDNCKK